jgi:hypothetical protein
VQSIHNLLYGSITIRIKTLKAHFKTLPTEGRTEYIDKLFNELDVLLKEPE